MGEAAALVARILDGALVEAARRGEQAAWDQIVDKLAPFVWEAAKAVSTSPAQCGQINRLGWLRLADNLEWLDAQSIAPWLVQTVEREAHRMEELGAGRSDND